MTGASPRAGTAASYLTPPLGADNGIIGAGRCIAWIRSSVPDVDLQVTVSEVRPDGKETYVQSGWLRASMRKLDQRRSTLLEPVLSLRREDAAKLPKGRFAKLIVPLYNQGHVYRAGSSIRVTLTAPSGDQPVWSFAEAVPRGTRTSPSLLPQAPLPPHPPARPGSYGADAAAASAQHCAASPAAPSGHRPRRGVPLYASALLLHGPLDDALVAGAHQSPPARSFATAERPARSAASSDLCSRRERSSTSFSVTPASSTRLTSSAAKPPRPALSVAFDPDDALAGGFAALVAGDPQDHRAPFGRATGELEADEHLWLARVAPRVCGAHGKGPLVGSSL